MKATTNENSKHVRARFFARPSLRWAGAGAALVTLLLSVSGGGGAVLAGTVSLHSPYSGTLAANSIYGSVSGCVSSVTNPVKGHWAPSTGAVTMSGSAKAAACGATNSGSSANVQNGVTIAIPIPISANGTHLVKLKWSFTVALTKSSKGATHCPPPVINSYGYGNSYCSVYAYASINAYVHTEDVTNGTYWYPSNYWSGVTNASNQYSSEYCNGGTCSFSNSSSNTYGGLSLHSFTWWMNVTASKGDRVIVVLNVNGYASVSAYGYPRASASAAFNLATLGNIGHVVWVQVS